MADQFFSLIEQPDQHHMTDIEKRAAFIKIMSQLQIYNHYDSSKDRTMTNHMIEVCQACFTDDVHLKFFQDSVNIFNTNHKPADRDYAVRLQFFAKFCLVFQNLLSNRENDYNKLSYLRFTILRIHHHERPLEGSSQYRSDEVIRTLSQCSNLKDALDAIEPNHELDKKYKDCCYLYDFLECFQSNIFNALAYKQLQIKIKTNLISPQKYKFAAEVVEIIE
jgi:hypothetical protein